MKFRIIYHKNKIFYYYEYLNYSNAEKKNIETNNDNKVIIDISENKIIKKEGNDIVINRILKYNNNNLFNFFEKKYHIAIYFVGHFIPKCDDLIELQLNNYKNCTFDIFIVTEKNRLYGRFNSTNHLKNLFNIYDKKEIKNIYDNDIYKMFGKYSKYIKAISYIEDNIEEYNKILNDNINYYEKTYKTKLNLKSVRGKEYYKLYKAYLLKKEYSKKNNIKYDFIFKTRPDIVLQCQIKLTSFYKNLSNKNVFGRNNIFLFSNEENMNWICKVILYYYRYNNCKFGPEPQLLNHIRAKNLKLNYKIEKDLKKIRMLRLWIINKNNYFEHHTKNIELEEKKYWQLYKI